ncbi:MAG: maleylacetate reductase [Cucumibacter sp.]
MEAFVYEALPQRVVFGFGTRTSLPQEVDRLGLTRVMVLSTPEQAAMAGELSALLGGKSAGVLASAAMHTPVEVTEKALEKVRAAAVDGLVPVGGGSTTGLGKAIALRSDLPQIVLPTTYAGSEATSIIGQTEGGRKTTQRTSKVLPETILYDVELTASLPVGLSVTSGLNAIAHAVEARYARDRNPLISILALEGIRALAGALPRIVRNPEDLMARSDALYGAWACGTCLGAVEMALHHKVCHTLGGSFDLPHAETHAVMLPHTTAYNEAIVRDLLAPVAQCLGAPSAARGLYDLAASLGAPTRLGDLGMAKAAIGRAADLILQNPYWNPRPLVREHIVAMLEDAFEGRPPPRPRN